MMDALSLLVKPAQEPAASTKSGKAGKGGDTAEKGGFSRELKGLNTDERGGKGADRDTVSTGTEETATDADSAGAVKVNTRIAPAATGPSSFASLRVEFRTTIDATMAKTAAQQDSEQQQDETVQVPDIGLDVQVPEESLTDRILPEVAEDEVVPTTERDDRRKADAASDTDAADPATVDAGPKTDAETLSNVLGLLSAGANVTDRPEPKLDAGNGKREAEKIGNTGTVSAETQDTVMDAGVGVGVGEGEGLAMDDQSDRLFRLTRGEGRGQSVDLKIASTADGQIDVEARSPASGQPETVNVLETRRYLGFNAPSNSSTLTAALAGNDEWVSAMHPSARLANAAQQSSTGQVVNTLKLELNPHALGTVTAVLRLSGDELNVHLTVHTAAAYREMKEDSSGMLDALRSQGFSVDQVTVSMASAASPSQDGGDASGRFAQQQQQNMQQAAGEGGRNGDRGAPQNGRQDGSDGQSGVAAGRSDDSEQNLGVARGAGGTRPSHVYI